MEVGKIIETGENAATVGVVFEFVEDVIDLIDFAFGKLVFFCELVAVGFADRAGLVGPSVPNVAF